jgi:hypothetical protein
MPKTRTEEMIDELRECEVIAGVLDQVAIAQGPAISRAYYRFCKELLDLRDSELRDWNDEAPRWQRIYRCDNASHPYHTVEADGPCEVFTVNTMGDVHLCNTCADRMAAALTKEASK